jgi:hypothetical protein
VILRNFDRLNQRLYEFLDGLNNIATGLPIVIVS